LQKDPLIVSDPEGDERFKDNPLVTGEPGIKFYAGVPIKDPIHQLPIGTLCVIDKKNRVLTNEQVDMLTSLAEQVNSLLQLRIHYKELKKIEEKILIHKTAFNQMLEGMVLQNNKDEIIEYNQSAFKVLGITENQLLGKSSFDSDWNAIKSDGSPFEPYEHPSVVAMATGKPQANTLMGIKVGASELRWIMINSTPIHLESEKNPTHTVTTFADITSTKKSEELLYHSAKMSSLGEMAAGMAHEINTPLAIIRMAAEQIRRACSDPTIDQEAVLKKTTQIDSTVEKIAHIISSLRSYSRSSITDQNEEIYLSKTIQETLTLCHEKLIDNQIELKVLVSENLKVRSLNSQLLQILLNLINNSIDAITLTDAPWIKIETKLNKDNVLLSVTDSGNGIPLSVQEKMMAPFFTTKSPGKGTGLGLSISQRLAESMGAKLFYDNSSPYTCFVIQLPVARQN
jgi:nitrogen fixation/metabolism regulation signal transduction histidine kinase